MVLAFTPSCLVTYKAVRHGDVTAPELSRVRFSSEVWVMDAASRVTISPKPLPYLPPGGAPKSGSGKRRLGPSFDVDPSAFSWHPLLSQSSPLTFRKRSLPRCTLGKGYFIDHRSSRLDEHRLSCPWFRIHERYQPQVRNPVSSHNLGYF